MPAPVQDIYQEACLYYKKMRSLHEKMKLVATDMDRAATRKDLLNVSDKHSSCWKMIEQWAADGTLPEKKNSKPSSDPPSNAESAPDFKAVGTARVNIGRDLKTLDGDLDEQKRASLIARLRANVAIIQAAGGAFGKNAAKLVELGITPAE